MLRLALWFPVLTGLIAPVFAPVLAIADELPFKHEVQIYRSAEGDVVAFALLLEQPFLAEEFEKNGFLRLRSLDDASHLIYPKETRFQRKHASFHGRLRGSGKAKLRLTYQTVSENLDGSRRMVVRQGDVEIAIPAEATGAERVFKDWARGQNAHFRRLLNFYPDESFLQYCLLQSKQRYGISAPRLPKPSVSSTRLEERLYHIATGSLAIQQALQRETLSGSSRVGDLDTHISTLEPPELSSLPYAELLEEKLAQGKEPRPHAISKLIPEDYYLAQFNSMNAQVFGISVDPPFSQKVFSDNNNLNFPLLSDFKRDAVNAYGIPLPNMAGMEGYVAAQRAVFVIDKAGVIRYKWVGETPANQPDFDEVQRQVDQLN